MAEPLKNRFQLSQVELLGQRLSEHDPSFDLSGFVTVAESFARLELKDRVAAVADAMARSLPSDYVEAIGIVVATAEAHDFEMFEAWPLASFVERHGLREPALSLDAMEALTRTFTCEFAIRPFLVTHLDLTMAACHEWTQSSDADVRRLASEGTRPLLPWAPRVAGLLASPERGLALLEELRHDDSEMVRRSVANQFNDVAKHAPSLVTSTLRRWETDPRIDRWMIRHALRTLVKQGNTEALEILGFTTEPLVSVAAFTINRDQVELGDTIELAAELCSQSETEQRLVIDFVIHHPTASGGVSRKVFKWTTLELGPNESAAITKRRLIKTATTRRYTAGIHSIELQVAGQVFGTCSFNLAEGSR